MGIKEQLKEQGVAAQASETKNLESSNPKKTEKEISKPNTDSKKEK